MSSPRRMLGISRERRKFKKAYLMGENKRLRMGILERDALIEAMNKELVRVMYERAGFAISIAAVLNVVKKRAGCVYTDIEGALYTHADRMEYAPLVISDSDLVIVAG